LRLNVVHRALFLLFSAPETQASQSEETLNRKAAGAGHDVTARASSRLRAIGVRRAGAAVAADGQRFLLVESTDLAATATLPSFDP